MRKLHQLYQLSEKLTRGILDLSINKASPKFDFWVEQLLARIYLPCKQIPDYPTPSRGTKGLTKKNLSYNP